MSNIVDYFSFDHTLEIDGHRTNIYVVVEIRNGHLDKYMIYDKITNSKINPKTLIEGELSLLADYVQFYIDKRKESENGDNESF